jgi:hypothetical protein
MSRRLAVAVKVTATSYHAVHVKQPKLSAQLSAMGEEEKTNSATYSRFSLYGVLLEFSCCNMSCNTLNFYVVI